jgi:sugar phosphate isomerase/epimerase
MFIAPMKRLLPLLLLSITGAFAGDFAGPAGLQLYSLRDTFKTDPVAALDKAKAFGFKTAELYSSLPVPPEQLKPMLAERGIAAISGHFSYDDLKKDPSNAVKAAQTLGLQYAGVAWIPHEIGNFGSADVQRAAADFHTVGEAFKAAGIQFFYHVHGYEFRPIAEGATETFFDQLAAATKPELVAFEMDVFWVVQPGADPVKLLEKYAGRWQLMHLKDIRKGARTGVFTGKAPLTDDVALGTGLVDWPTLLRTAAKTGVKHYFIEDESPTVLEQIPASLKYLESLR